MNGRKLPSFGVKVEVLVRKRVYAHTLVRPSRSLAVFCLCALMFILVGVSV
jgi:hypothetical protein